MTVSKYQNGRWRVNVYIGPLADRLPAPYTGKERLTKVFDTRREAAAQEREWEELKDALRSGDARGMTIAEWHKVFLKLDRRESTQKVYESATNPFAAKNGHHPIATWTTQQARADAATRSAAQVKYIKTMFAEAVQRGVIENNPYREVKQQRFDNQKTKAAFHEVWPIDPQRQVKLLDTILKAAEAVGQERGSELRGMIAFAAWTGCRPGEIRGLHREDLDTKSGFAYIRRVIDKTGQEIQTTKNGLHRKVFVPPQALIELRAVPVHLNVPYVFTNRGAAWKSNTFSNYWSLIRQRANLGRMRFYDMRHFCATQLLEMGASPEDVAAQLGHQDGGALVRQVYGHPSHDRALERIRNTMRQHTDEVSSQVRHIRFGEPA